MGISNRLGEKLPLSAELLIRRVTGDPHSAQWTIKATGLASLFYHGSKQSYLMSSYLLYYHKDRTHLGLAKTRQQVVHRKSLCGWKQDSILSETRRAAPSLCGGSVDSRAIVLKTKLFSCTRPRHGSHFLRAFLTGRRFTAIPNRRAYADEKEILLMWCTTIWRTTPSIFLGSRVSVTNCVRPLP